MRLISNSAFLLSSLLAATTVSAYARHGGHYQGQDISARDAYAGPYAYGDDDFSIYARDAYPEADAYSDDDFGLYARDAEPDFDEGLVARDAYLDGYMAGLAKRDAEFGEVLWARGNKQSKPDHLKEMDKWENDKDRKKKQKDLDEYLKKQQKEEEKRRKKEEKEKKKGN